MYNCSWINHLLPMRCLLCSSPAGPSLSLCEGCFNDLPANSPAACIQCARPLLQPKVCGRCLRHPPAFTETIAAMRYQGCSETLIHRFKFAGDQAAGKILATILAEHAQRATRPDDLLPIPLSRQRLRIRGFDQSWQLTRRIAKLLDLSTNLTSVRRCSNHVPQSSLNSWAARKRNVHGVFHVEPSAVLNKHIALVDDVMTSGATANTLAIELKRAGAKRVDVWVACRAGFTKRN